MQKAFPAFSASDVCFHTAFRSGKSYVFTKKPVNTSYSDISTIYVVFFVTGFLSANLSFLSAYLSFLSAYLSFLSANLSFLSANLSCLSANLSCLRNFFLFKSISDNCADYAATWGVLHFLCPNNL